MGVVKPAAVEQTDDEKPRRKWTLGRVLWVTLLVLFGLPLIAGLISGLSGNSSKTSDSTSTTPQANTPPAIDQTLLQQCHKLIDNGQRQGVIGTIRYSIVTKVVVKPLFYSLEYDAKLGVARAIRYAARAEGFADSPVRFIDSHTNKTVGEYPNWRGELDWKSN